MKGKLNNISELSSLIVKRFLGLLSQEEKRECDSLLDDKEIFSNGEDLKSEKYLKSRLLEDKDFGEQAALENFEKILKGKQKIKLYRIARVAAVITLPIILTIVGDWVISNKNSNLKNQLTERIVPGKNKAYITLYDGKVIDLDKKSKNVWNQRGALLSVDSGKIEYQSIINDSLTKEAQISNLESNELIYNTVNVPRGAEFFLTLTDGTKVWINSESELKYPVTFTKNTREVYIKGEAYFKVKKDASKPFIVNTSRGKVKVLGTSFNVRDYSDENKVLTTLVEGSVNLMSKEGNNNLILKPSEQGEFCKSGKIYKRKVDVDLFISWKEGRFTFRKQRLEYIMNVLARWYNIEVFFLNESQRDILFSGDIKRYDDFDKILKMLQMAGNTKFQVKGRSVIIRE